MAQIGAILKHSLACMEMYLQQVYSKSRMDHTLHKPLKTWLYTGPQYQQWDDHYDTLPDALYQQDPTTNIILRHDSLPHSNYFQQFGNMV
jgi:hypothetical protein